MKRLYKGCSKGRLLIDTRCDLSGYVTVTLMARKPDESIVSFSAVVKDAEKGTAFYDVQSENDFDKSGWWTFWVEVIFDDDRTACSGPDRKFVYEKGR